MNFWDGITARCYYNYRVCGVDRLTPAVVTRQLNVVGGAGGAARYNGACARPEEERESEYAPVAGSGGAVRCGRRQLPQRGASSAPAARRPTASAGCGGVRAVVGRLCTCCDQCPRRWSCFV